jgi:hypothetical protein
LTLVPSVVPRTPLGLPTNVEDRSHNAAELFAVQMPPECVVQEVMVTPLTKTSWA